MRLLHDIAAKRLPERRPRSNPRVVKRKMSNFKLKRAEQYQPPKPQGSIRSAIIVQWEPLTPETQLPSKAMMAVPPVVPPER